MLTRCELSPVAQIAIIIFWVHAQATYCNDTHTHWTDTVLRIQMQMTSRLWILFLWTIFCISPIFCTGMCAKINVCKLHISVALHLGKVTLVVWRVAFVFVSVNTQLTGWLTDWKVVLFNYHPWRGNTEPSLHLHSLNQSSIGYVL